MKASLYAAHLNKLATFARAAGGAAFADDLDVLASFFGSRPENQTVVKALGKPRARPLSETMFTRIDVMAMAVDMLRDVASKTLITDHDAVMAVLRLCGGETMAEAVGNLSEPQKPSRRARAPRPTGAAASDATPFVDDCPLGTSVALEAPERKSAKRVVSPKKDAPSLNYLQTLRNATAAEAVDLIERMGSDRAFSVGALTELMAAIDPTLRGKTKKDKIESLRRYYVLRRAQDEKAAVIRTQPI